MVELALFLPVYFVITMATIETCRMLYLRQSLKIAAYECARLAILPGAKADDVRTQCDVILQGRRVRNYTFSMNPPDPKTLKYGDIFVATVEIAANDNALVGSWFYSGRKLVESVSIMAEQ